MKKKMLAFLIVSVLFVPSVVFAQNFSGTYILKAQGATLTLTLKQDTQGSLEGVLSSSTGTRYQVEGMIQDGVAVGTCANNQEGAFFEARLQGERLLFAMIEPNRNNMPDYSKVRQLTFARQAAEPGSPGTQGQPGGRTSQGSAAQGTRPPGSGTSAQMSTNELSDPGWGFKLKLPTGWKGQKTGQGAILGHDTVAGVILVLPHMAKSLQEVQSEMQQGLSEEGLHLVLTGGLKPLQSSAVAGDYSGTAQGQQVKAKGIGTLSPHGGGVFIVAVAVPDKFSPQLSGAAEAIARQMQYVKAEASDVMGHFVGTWVNMTKNSQTMVTLQPDGTYAQKYEASYSGKSHDQLGNQTMGWGHARDDHDRGRWTVRGTRQEGTLILKPQSGGETAITYRVHVERGKTYWNEYWFDGKLYGKQ